MISIRNRCDNTGQSDDGVISRLCEHYCLGKLDLLISLEGSWKSIFRPRNQGKLEQHIVTTESGEKSQPEVK